MYKQKIDKVREEVISLFEMSDEDLFNNSKRYKMVDARKIFFTVCHELGIHQVYIREYMLDEKGFDTPHSNVSKSIAGGIERARKDKNFRKLLDSVKSKI